jgi:hypothetical protein
MHRKGIHCGSTAMGDALRAKGLDLPEEQVFGLGSGAAFKLYDGDGSLTPPQATRFFVGRSLSFEQDLCDAIGANLQSRSYLLADQAELHELDLVYTDLLELPYLKVRGHWFGHLVVIAGFEKDQVLVWDNELEGTQKLPKQQLQKAMSGPTPAGLRGLGVTVLHLESAPKEVPENAAKKAILRNALQMTEQAALGEGVEGIEQLAREFDQWRKVPDWERRARLVSQVIETRGCGGGLFRRMYARFLKQSLPALEPLCLRAADAWTAFAQKLETPQIKACAAAERALWSRALELCE